MFPVISLCYRKDGHIYFTAYRCGDENKALDVIDSWLNNPQLNFNDKDADILYWKIFANYHIMKGMDYGQHGKQRTSL